MTFFPGGGKSRGFCLPEIGGSHRGRRRSLFTGLLLAGSGLSLLLLTACDTPGERADTLAQQAAMLAGGNDRIGALRAIHEAISLRDNKAEYFLLLAQIHLRAGEAADAYLAGRRALELDAANKEALNLVANLGLQVGEMDAASRAAEQLLALDPNSLVGLQVRGLIQLYRNQEEAAAATAEQILRLNPADEAGMIIRARVLAKQAKYEEALAFVEAGLSRAPNSGALVITRINLDRALQRPAAMAAGFARLAELAPGRGAALMLDEINLLYKIGRTAQARDLTTRLLAQSVAKPGDLAVLLRLWREYDRVPFTRETIKAAKDWGDPVILLNVGRYLLLHGQPQLADDLYFNAPQALRGIGVSIHLRAAYALGNMDVVRDTLPAVLKDDPENVDGLLLQSLLHERAGRLDLALEAAQRAMNSDQTNPETYIVQARLQARSGAAWRAGQIFEEGLQQMPQNFPLIEGYTQFLHDSGNKSRAVSVSRAFARGLPSSVLAWEIMARQCGWTDNAACAAEASAGKAAAATRYSVDDRPGAPPDRGLLGKF